MDFEERNRNTNSRLRSIYDYTMGVLWLAIGVFFLAHKKLGYDLQLDSALTVIFGVSSTLYGAFRIYRGFQNK